MMKYVTAFVVAVALASPSAGQPRSADAFLETLQSAVDRRDRQAVARLVQYPLTVVAGLQVRIPDTATFIRLYDTFFTPEARCAIMQARTAGSGPAADIVQVTPEGMSIGSGLLWAARSGTSFKITRMIARGAPAPTSRPAPRRVSFYRGQPSTQMLGALERDDADAFVVAVRQGQIFEATINGFRGQDAGIRVLDAHGAPIETRLHVGPRTWSGVAPATADYRIEVARLAPYCNPMVRYELTVTLR